jgi:hypothetical protein
MLEAPLVLLQNAFGCMGQSSDLTATSPEGVNLDVIGYDLIGAPFSPPLTDFNNDRHPDYLLYKSSVGRTQIWYLNNNVSFGSADASSVPGPWQVVGVADFNRDGHPDYLLFNPATRGTVIWYMNYVHFSGLYVRFAANNGPTLPASWSVVALADFNWDGYPDYLLSNTNTRRTVVWYMRNNIHFASNNGPTLTSGWSLSRVADFNGDGHPDYLLFRPSTGQSVIWYMSGVTHISSRSAPTIPAGYALAGVADFNGNGKPDFVLYNSSDGQTAIWYMNDNVRIGSVYGPTLPSGWSLIAP